MSDEAPMLDPERLRKPERRHEWVTLPRVGKLCVRELLLSEGIRVSDLSQRPPIDPRGGVDREESALWQIALACYDGPGEEAKRLFDDHQVVLIKNFTVEEFTIVMMAINRVNGMEPQEVELLRDFTAAPPEQRS